MSTIQEIFQQAQLADAAYANFVGSDSFSVVLKKNFGNSQTQADNFLGSWDIVSQFTETGILSNGFSATLFQKKDSSLPGTQYTLAFRGSQSSVDFLGADLDLAVGGVALNQLVSMVNYVLRLKVGANGFTQQLVPLGTTLTSTFVSGVGPGISPSQLTVSGHSLGGYLAQVYQRLFGGAGAFTFNALGITDTNCRSAKLMRFCANIVMLDVGGVFRTHKSCTCFTHRTIQLKTPSSANIALRNRPAMFAQGGVTTLRRCPLQMPATNRNARHPSGAHSRVVDS